MKLRLLSTPLALLTALAAFGCSSSSTKAPAGGDSGTTPTEAGTDSGKSDGSVDTGGGGSDAESDAAPLPKPTGTLLVGTDSGQLIGVTSDNYVIYEEANATGTSGSIFAVPTAGGTPKLVAALTTTSFFATVQGALVLVWPGLSTNGVGPVSSWTSTGGIHSITTASYYAQFGVSSDGTHLVYTANVPDSAKTGDVVVANIDGTDPKTLLTGISLQGACTPLMGFEGTGSGTYFLASYCPTATGDAGTDAGSADGGTAGATLSNWTGASWTETDMATNLPLLTGVCGAAPTACALWSTDKSATKAVVTTAANELEALPLPSGAAISVDDVGAQTQFGVLRSDGSGVIYATAGGLLKQSPLPAAAPATLVTTGTTPVTILQVSPDSNYVMYSTAVDTSNGFENLYLASTKTAGTPVTLSSTMTALTTGVDFTTDSSHALYYTDGASLTNPNGGASPGTVGTLTSIPVAGGSPTALGPMVWDGFVGAGTTVIFQGNFIPSATSGDGIADILVADVSSSKAATTIVQASDVIASLGDDGFVLTADKSKLIYSFSIDQSASADADVDAGPDLNGIYIIAVP